MDDNIFSKNYNRKIMSANVLQLRKRKNRRMDFRAYLQTNAQRLPCPLPSPISLPRKHPGGIHHEYTTHVGSVVYSW